MNGTKRIMKRQADLRKIWIDALTHSPARQSMSVSVEREGKIYTERAFLRGGYKIQHTEPTDIYELFHINTSDRYKYPDDDVINDFVKHGWLDTTDRHQIERCKLKYVEYDDKIKKASEERNDSIITHYRNKRLELANKISRLEEKIIERQKTIKFNTYETQQ